jgi:hypothetical protein
MRRRANATNSYSAAGAPGSAQTGVWTHLVGECNAVTGKLSLTSQEWTGTGWILKSQATGDVLDCNASGTP